jgi:hypothetical protein
MAENRIIVSSNADDFRKLVRQAVDHPGLAVLLDAVGRPQPIVLGTVLASAVDAVIAAGGTARGRVFEIAVSAWVRNYAMP